LKLLDSAPIAVLLTPLVTAQGFGPQTDIDAAVDGASCVVSGDVNGDGSPDVVGASRFADEIFWHENNGGGSFLTRHLITTSADGPLSVVVADLDGDGDQDVVSASHEDDTIAWYENLDGQGTFGALSSISSQADAAWEVRAADIDGDGDLDVLSASYSDDKIAWYENLDGQGAFGAQRIISLAAIGARSVFAADLDGDGDADVLSASVDDDKVAWYENEDGLGGFGTQQVITTATDLAWSVHAGDLDGDGDIDVVSASSEDGRVAWYENVDGKGTFGPQQTITTDASGARSVVVANLNGDGALDVLAASSYDDKVSWYANSGSVPVFTAQSIVSTAGDFPVHVATGDLDGDGGNDVLAALADADKIGWYKNLVTVVSIADVSDVLASSSALATITGENFDGQTTVALDGVAVSVWAWTPTTLTIQPGPAAPGLVDVTVQKALTEMTAPESLALWPTLEAETSGIGGSLDVTLWNGEPGLYALALGVDLLPAPVSISSPPTWYGVLLNPAVSLFTISTGAFASGLPIDLSFPVPNQPSLMGQTFHFQAWCQQGVFGPELTYSFTNATSVAL